MDQPYVAPEGSGKGVPLPLTGVPLQPELGLSLQLPSTPDQKPVLGSQLMMGVPKKPCLQSAVHR
jgi:hypothetical protein